MKVNFYSVFDTATGAYMRPWTMMSDQQAIRAFTAEATNAESDVGRNPEDFSLFRLGSFDDVLGAIESCDPPRVLAKAHELVAQSRNS